jgi:hypothetical protein
MALNRPVFSCLVEAAWISADLIARGADPPEAVYRGGVEPVGRPTEQRAKRNNHCVPHYRQQTCTGSRQSKWVPRHALTTSFASFPQRMA